MLKILLAEDYHTLNKTRPAPSTAAYAEPVQFTIDVGQEILDVWIGQYDQL